MNFDHHGSNTGYAPSQAAILHHQQAQQRKSSLNPTAILSGNPLQKSLNSIDFQQAKNQGSKSVPRGAPEARSRDKLPQIGLNTK